jgi:hypothetical protein
VDVDGRATRQPKTNLQKAVETVVFGGQETDILDHRSVTVVIFRQGGYTIGFSGEGRRSQKQKIDSQYVSRNGLSPFLPFLEKFRPKLDRGLDKCGEYEAITVGGNNSIITMNAFKLVLTKRPYGGNVWKVGEPMSRCANCRSAYGGHDENGQLVQSEYFTPSVEEDFPLPTFEAFLTKYQGFFSTDKFRVIMSIPDQAKVMYGDKPRLLPILSYGWIYQSRPSFWNFGRQFPVSERQR